MNILLIGEESAGAQTLKLLAGGPHHLVGVMASPTRKAAGGMTVWQLAEKLGCRTWPAELVKDPSFAEEVIANQVDLILNIHSLFVIKGEIVEAPRFGSFNLHPGPLPRYAGLNAPSWAIYHDEKVHGVTLHRMLAGIDTGPIAYQALFDIADNETGFTLATKCIKSGMDLIKRLLDTAGIDPRQIPAIEQDLSKRSYFGKGTPEDGWLDWSRPAREIYNFVRAADYSPFHSPWKTPRSRSGGKEVGFIRVSLTGQRSDAPPGTVQVLEDGRTLIASGDDWVEINRVALEGGATSPAELLISGDRLEWDRNS
ncbi:MAG: methionyl-tRNA formyltransferase [Acidobacteriota bacterium]|nr:MAG: methionyl-tRNA formyltransferase [Acidobacteriota bacterium]